MSISIQILILKLNNNEYNYNKCFNFIDINESSEVHFNILKSNLHLKLSHSLKLCLYVSCLVINRNLVLDAGSNGSCQYPLMKCQTGECMSIVFYDDIYVDCLGHRVDSFLHGIHIFLTLI